MKNKAHPDILFDFGQVDNTIKIIKVENIMMNITRMLEEVKVVSDLEEIVTVLEGYYNVAIQSSIITPHDHSIFVTIVEIQDMAKEVMNWIDNRLESGYYSGNEETLSGLRASKGKLFDLINGAKNEEIRTEELNKMGKYEILEDEDYNLLGLVSDEKDALESFMSDYSSGYICDNISEISDNFIPIYHNDIWKHAYDISEYIESAIDEGIAPTGVNKGADLEAIFQSGYYIYYQRSLYDNLDQMVYNMIVRQVNDYLKAVKVYNLDIEAIESEIEDKKTGYDNNEDMESIEEIAKEIVQDIREGAYRIEE